MKEDEEEGAAALAAPKELAPPVGLLAPNVNKDPEAGVDPEVALVTEGSSLFLALLAAAPNEKVPAPPVGCCVVVFEASD